MVIDHPVHAACLEHSDVIPEPLRPSHFGTLSYNRLGGAEIPAQNPEDIGVKLTLINSSGAMFEDPPNGLNGCNNNLKFKFCVSNTTSW